MQLEQSYEMLCLQEIYMAKKFDNTLLTCISATQIQTVGTDMTANVSYQLNKK